MAEAEPACALVGRERPVGPGVPDREIAGGVSHRLQELLGQPLRQRRAKRIAVPRGILRRDVARHPSNRHTHDSPRPLERSQNRVDVLQGGTRGDLGLGEIADSD
jgi:hypothetical protein